MYLLLSLIWSDACNKMATINNATCSEGTGKVCMSTTTTRLSDCDTTMTTMQNDSVELQIVLLTENGICTTRDTMFTLQARVTHVMECRHVWPLL